MLIQSIDLSAHYVYQELVLCARCLTLMSAAGPGRGHAAGAGKGRIWGADAADRGGCSAAGAHGRHGLQPAAWRALP